MRRFFAILLLVWPLAALGQEMAVTLGGLKADPAAEVQVTADRLTVDQAEGLAVFDGAVEVTQGTMRLTAGRIEVLYAADGTSIAEMRASGGVAMAAGGDTAKGRSAVYRPEAGDLTMTGDVTLTQGGAVITGQSLVLDLGTGLGAMEGRVTTTFAPKAKGG